MNHHNPILFCESFDGRNAANHLGCIKHDVNSEINFTSMINRRFVGWLPSTGGEEGSTSKIITDVVS